MGSLSREDHYIINHWVERVDRYWKKTHTLGVELRLLGASWTHNGTLPIPDQYLAFITNLTCVAWSPFRGHSQFQINIWHSFLTNLTCVALDHSLSVSLSLCLSARASCHGLLPCSRRSAHPAHGGHHAPIP